MVAVRESSGAVKYRFEPHRVEGMIGVAQEPIKSVSRERYW
jgi:hypothetical protein